MLVAVTVFRSHFSETATETASALKAISFATWFLFQSIIARAVRRTRFCIARDCLACRTRLGTTALISPIVALVTTTDCHRFLPLGEVTNL